MALRVTQCPSCESTFNTSASMLEAAHGLVRCGACFSVFEADKNFVSESDPATGKQQEPPAPHEVFISGAEDYFDPSRFLKDTDLQESEDPILVSPPASAKDIPDSKQEKPAATPKQGKFEHIEPGIAVDKVNTESKEALPVPDVFEVPDKLEEQEAEKFIANSNIFFTDDSYYSDDINFSEQEEIDAEADSGEPIDFEVIDLTAEIDSVTDEDFDLDAEIRSRDAVPPPPFEFKKERQQPEFDTASEHTSTSPVDQVDAAVNPVNLEESPKVHASTAASTTVGETATTPRQEPADEASSSAQEKTQIYKDLTFISRKKKRPPEVTSSAVKEESSQHHGIQSAEANDQLSTASENPQVRPTPTTPKQETETRVVQEEADKPVPTGSDTASTKSDGAVSANLRSSIGQVLQSWTTDGSMEKRPESEDAQTQDSIEPGVDGSSGAPDPTSSADADHTLEARSEAHHIDDVPSADDADLPTAQDGNLSAAPTYESQTDSTADANSALIPAQGLDTEQPGMEENLAPEPIKSVDEATRRSHSPEHAAEENLSSGQPDAIAAGSGDTTVDTESALESETGEDSRVEKEAIRAKLSTTPLLDTEEDGLSAENLAAIQQVDSSLELPQSAKPARSIRRPLVATLSLMLVLIVLLTTFLWVRMPLLSLDTRLRPWYETTCSVIGCQLPALQDLRNIQIENLVVRGTDSSTNTLTMGARFRNTGSFRQPFPIIELRFTNLDNQLVSIHEYYPAEYLPDALQTITDMPVGQPVQISVDLADPGANAINYELTFKPYPTAID